MKPPVPINETARVDTIDRLGLFDDRQEIEYEHVLDLLQLATGLPINLFSVVGRDKQFFKARRGIEVAETPRDHSFCAWAIADGDESRPFVVEDASLDERFSNNPLVTGKPHIRFYAGLPVRAPNQILVGTLCTISNEPGQLTPAIDKALRAARALLEDALVLKHESVRDPLTGLFNRRFFDEGLDREWRRAYREMLPLTVMLADVDYFKSYNDTYGHAAGDEALRQVSAALRQRVQRSGDFVARYGGEEFVLVMPCTGVDGASKVASRIVQLVHELGIDNRAGVEGRMTISVGASVATAKLDAVHGKAELMKMADEALYDAKRSGRNQFRVRELGSGVLVEEQT